MASVKFGGPLPAIMAGGARVSPRPFGQAEVMGNVDQSAARDAIMKHIGAQLEQAARAGTLLQTASSPSLASNVAAAASAELKASVSVTMLNVSFSDEDLAALKNPPAAALGTAPTMAGAMPGPIPPGTHVQVSWTDGRTYGAVVRSFNGSQYEIAWDGATTTAWAPLSAVRPG